jgi:phosphatidate cytidylyltransferase
MTRPDSATLWLIGGVLAVLGIATVVGWWLKRRLDTGLDPAILRQFHLRLRTYWLVSTVLAMSLYLGQIATVVLFGFLSFWALREFITLTPTRRADHRGLFWAFFIFTPLQYVLVAANWHEVYSVLIPGFAFLFLAARVAFAGDTKRFLERTAKTQAGLMLCVYCLSYAPALLTQDLGLPKPSPPNAPGDALPPSEPSGPSDPATPNGSPSPLVSELGAKPATGLNGQQQGDGDPATPSALPDEPVAESARADELVQESQKARLLFFLVLIAQLSDIMQYLWGKVFPGRVIAPEVNPTKTWGGYLGGILSAAVLGALLWRAVAPFTIWEAALLAAVVAAAGLAGGLTMSAIKRDRGVRDFSTLVVGHGGVLDRIDSLCFAAPVFFYLTRILLWLDSHPFNPWTWLRELWLW